MLRRVVFTGLAIGLLAALAVLLRLGGGGSEPQARTFIVTIRGTTMTPSQISVTDKDSVVLKVTADVPVKFHLHGYDIERNLERGREEVISFEAVLTGRFEIEDESTQRELGTLAVSPR